MTDALTSLAMSTELQKVAERAKREPAARFNSLAHLIDEELLAKAYRRLRRHAAVGVDGISKEEYGQDLKRNLKSLHERMRTKRYRHQPIRRVHIPKEQGHKTRPIGISTTEDKVVQSALREVLEVVYEQDFLDCSHGFRPKRNAHGAVRALTQAVNYREANWILEFDIASFFDSVDRTKLMKLLQKRVTDGSIHRLVGKCLHVGVLDGEEISEPSEGTAQGSTLSPLLGNVYLHYVLDLWFQEEVRPRLHGKSMFVRYADDGIFGFEREEDARRVLAVLGKRLERFGLTLHPDKTRLLDFRRPSPLRTKGRSPTTFDFLGFTWYWRRNREGRWSVRCKTRRARLARAVHTVQLWCKEHRHMPVREQHAALTRRMQGHINYFGVNGNVRSLKRFVRYVQQKWYRWLRRRSQRARLTWARFLDLLKAYPLPSARITVQIWS
jgi:group II intron reverse transcriptase/maturase